MSSPDSPAFAVRAAMMGTAARVNKNPAPDMAALAATAQRMAGSDTVREGHRAMRVTAKARAETWACLDCRKAEGGPRERDRERDAVPRAAAPLRRGGMAGMMKGL